MLYIYIYIYIYIERHCNNNKKEKKKQKTRNSDIWDKVDGLGMALKGQAFYFPQFNDDAYNAHLTP